MKITKEYLKEIIKEAIEESLYETKIKSKGKLSPAEIARIERESEDESEPPYVYGPTTKYTPPSGPPKMPQKKKYKKFDKKLSPAEIARIERDSAD